MNTHKNLPQGELYLPQQQHPNPNTCMECEKKRKKGKACQTSINTHPFQPTEARHQKRVEIITTLSSSPKVRSPQRG